jgi:hypothetical protein
MNASLLLRIASVLTFFFCAGHTAGMPWMPAEGPEALAVVGAMKGHSFDIIGSQRSFWDFYFGFGLSISVFMFALAVLLWQIGSLAKTDAMRMRPFIATFFVAFAVNTGLAWKYIFIIPLVNSALIAVCLALAFFAAGRSKAG